MYKRQVGNDLEAVYTGTPDVVFTASTLVAKAAKARATKADASFMVPGPWMR